MRQILMAVLGTAILLSACSPAAPIPTTLPPTAQPPTGAPTPAATALPTQGHLLNVDWLAYHNEKAGFSISHPLTWQERGTGGYRVVFRLEAAPGTTLMDKTMEITVTEHATDCKETTFNSGTGPAPEAVTVNGISFLKEPEAASVNI